MDERTRVSQVLSQLQMSRELIEQTYKEFEQLSMRLSPVLRREENAFPVDKAKTEDQVPLALELSAMNAQLMGLARRLNDLTSRIEL